jgi:translocation and assembly module TamA
LRHALLLLMAAVLYASPGTAAEPQPYRVELVSTGNAALDATLKASSQLQTLRASVPANAFSLIARARGDLDRLQTVLESYGYYQGSVTITIDGMKLDDPVLGERLSALPAGTDAMCRASFELGPLYHLGTIDLDAGVPESARQALALSSGAPAVAGEVLAGGARLLTELENQGYAFARVDPPIAYEEPQRRLLNLSFHVVSGPKVQVGDIRIEGLKRVHETFVRRRLLLHTGQPYSAIAVEQARKDLLSLGLFAAVSVRLGTSADAQMRVPVTFRLSERPRHAIALNAGYSSDLGGSAGVTWTDRNMRGNGEQLTLAASATNIGGTATTGLGYDISAKYLIPEIWHRDQSLQFALGGIKQALQAYDQTAETSGVTLSRKLSPRWTTSVGVSAVHETIDQEGSTHVYTMFALPLTLNYDSTDLSSPVLDPTHGARATVSLAPTLSRGEPNATFYVSQASIAKYFDLRRLLGTEPGRSVVALRLLGASALGATQTTETVAVPVDNGSTHLLSQQVSVPDLPPDQRFYVGGSGTVRGYRYQSVGPEFPDGNPVGATSITAVNGEFRQRIGQNFGMAVFADAGEAGDDLNPARELLHGRRCSSSVPLQGAAPVQNAATCWAIGVGAGIRYYTPIGPVRLDFAIPTYRRSNDDRFEIYIGLGQAF